MLKWRSHDQDKEEIRKRREDGWEFFFFELIRKRREDRWENKSYSTLMVITTDSHTSHYSN